MFLSNPIDDKVRSATIKQQVIDGTGFNYSNNNLFRMAHSTNFLYFK
jgi:hypothetical protein